MKDALMIALAAALVAQVFGFAGMALGFSGFFWSSIAMDVVGFAALVVCTVFFIRDVRAK